MKKSYRIFIIVILIALIFATKVYAHGGNITGWNRRDSNAITFHNGNYYGYHHEAGIRHYHRVKWNYETDRWNILMPAVYFDEDFNIVPRILSEGLGRIQVGFNRIVDGDTARFELDGEIVIARFLGIDTPEMGRAGEPAEPFAIEATEYAENALLNASKIEIEYDENAPRYDVHQRHLVWIWVDGELLQERLMVAGLAETFMLQANYRYADILQLAESIAQENRIGIWWEEQEEVGVQNEENQNIYQYSILAAIGISIVILVVTIIKRYKSNSKKK